MALKDRIEMMICYYGCEKDNHSGIAYAQFIPEKNQFEIISKIEMEGKINFAIWHKNQLFVPIAQDYQNRIYLYEFDNQKFHQVEYFDTTYFYSYGVLINNHYGYFASFASGENAIIDFNRKSELDIKHYKNGRSHYINRLKKGQVYAIDNANNKLLIYDDEHQKLLTKKTIEFLDEGPRLMPSHPSGKLGYLLMERTNRIIVFDFDDFTELQRIDVPNTTIDVDFCGGITVDEKGCFLCVHGRRGAHGVRAPHRTVASLRPGRWSDRAPRRAARVRADRHRRHGRLHPRSHAAAGDRHAVARAHGLPATSRRTAHPDGGPADAGPCHASVRPARR